MYYRINFLSYSCNFSLNGYISHLVTTRSFSAKLHAWNSILDMNYFQFWGFFLLQCTVSLTYLQNSCLIENICLGYNLRLRHLKYMSTRARNVWILMIVGGHTAKKSTLISGSANPKIDVLNGLSTLMPCFLLHHFHLQTSKTPEYSTCTGARMELELLTTLLLSAYSVIEILFRAAHRMAAGKDS